MMKGNFRSPWGLHKLLEVHGYLLLITF
jgi:hypothetical protein